MKHKTPGPNSANHYHQTNILRLNSPETSSNSTDKSNLKLNQCTKQADLENQQAVYTFARDFCFISGKGPKPSLCKNQINWYRSMQGQFFRPWDIDYNILYVNWCNFPPVIATNHRICTDSQIPCTRYCGSFWSCSKYQPRLSIETTVDVKERTYNFV